MPNDIALRDGNGTPTLLYEENGEVRRVSTINPLPVADAGGVNAIFDTEMLEVFGSLQQNILTPAPGKRLIVRGVVITIEPATGIEATIRFASGKIVYKVYRGDHSGDFIPLRMKGAVDEALVVETTGFGGGQQAFFVVNFQEE